LEVWILSNARGSNGTLFIVTCWILWRRRNEALFNDVNLQHWEILSHIHMLVSDIHKAYGVIPHQALPWSVKWHPSPCGSYKFNVDCSSIGNPGFTSYRGLIRDYIGSWIGGFKESCGITTILNAELSAILYGFI